MNYKHNYDCTWGHRLACTLTVLQSNILTVDTVIDDYRSISDDSRVTHQLVASVMTVINDCNMFIVQSIGHSWEWGATSTRVEKMMENSNNNCCLYYKHDYYHNWWL